MFRLWIYDKTEELVYEACFEEYADVIKAYYEAVQTAASEENVEFMEWLRTCSRYDYSVWVKKDDGDYRRMMYAEFFADVLELV